MKKTILLLITVLLVSVSCQPPPTPTLAPTSVPPTTLASTSTPTPFTSAPLPPPTDVPEVLATKNEDIFGIWLVVFSPNDRLAPAETHWEHMPEGTRIATFISGPNKGLQTVGKYWFESGLYKTQYPNGTSEPNSKAVGTYQVYVTKQGDKAVQLRFVVIEDQYAQRVDRITFKPWTRVEP